MYIGLLRSLLRGPRTPNSASIATPPQAVSEMKINPRPNLLPQGVKRAKIQVGDYSIIIVWNRFVILFWHVWSYID